MAVHFQVSVAIHYRIILLISAVKYTPRGIISKLRGFVAGLRLLINTADTGYITNPAFLLIFSDNGEIVSNNPMVYIHISFVSDGE